MLSIVLGILCYILIVFGTLLGGSLWAGYQKYTGDERWVWPFIIFVAIFWPVGIPVLLIYDWYDNRWHV